MVSVKQLKHFTNTFMPLVPMNGNKTDLQSWIKYFKRAHYGKSSISIYDEFFASIDK